MDVLITGGNRGLGLETAKQLIDRGHRVFAGARNPDHSTATDLYVPVKLDLEDRKSLPNAINSMLSVSGKIDVLINNAGISNLGPAEDQYEREFERIMQTNFHSHHTLTRLVLPHMRTQGSGRVIMVSSISGLLGLPGETAYCCSKFAMEALAECLAYEVAEFGIRVSIINPSYTRTELAAATELDRATPVNSPYRAMMEKLLEVQQSSEAEGDLASIVAADVVAAATDPEPKFRYLPGASQATYNYWKNTDEDEFRTGVRQLIMNG